MKLEEIRSGYHNEVLKMRSIERILESKEFEAAFKKAPDREIDILSLMLLTYNVKHIRHWMQKQIEEPLGLRSYRALRDLAKNENVPRYSRLNRDQLIRALEKKRDL